MKYYIEHLPMTIPVGVQSENNAEAVEFEVSDWLKRDGSLSFSAWITRPGETEAYQAANTTLRDGVLYWWPSSADTAIAGDGRVEILAVSDSRRMLSGWTSIDIRETSTDTTTDTPVAQRPWLDQALLASAEAREAATSAAASADQAEIVAKKEIARETAPAIIPSAAGEFVSITDSAERPLAGLTLCGKTTQNGTPSPAASIPLVNVGAGGSITVTVENGGSLTASTPNGLAGIPVTSGGNYMDANGVHWYCDYRDYKNGINVQRVHVLDAASVAWNPNSINHAGDGYIFYTVLYGTLSQRDMLSNRFRQNQILSGGSWDVLSAGEATVIVDNGADLAYVILCMPAGINTADAINAYFAANPTTFLCAKKTPVITPIPADEMAAFRALKTNKPNTTIYNDAGAYMYVDYIADTKLYIDKKIAAIAAASLNV